MPNVGKSTLFNVRLPRRSLRLAANSEQTVGGPSDALCRPPTPAVQVLTKCSIPAENFPFCTIDPNNVRGAPQGRSPRAR